MGVDAGGGTKGSSLTPMSTPHPAPVDRFSESTVSFSLLSRCLSAAACWVFALFLPFPRSSSPYLPLASRLFHVQDAGLGFGVGRYASCAVFFPSALPWAVCGENTSMWKRILLVQYRHSHVSFCTTRAKPSTRPTECTWLSLRSIEFLFKVLP